MSTVAEIEAALPELTLEELRRLNELVDKTMRSRGMIGSSAGKWWADVEGASPADAEAFARDIEEGRAFTNRPSLDPWASS